LALFGPKKPLTRQQLAAIHAKKKIGILKDQQKTIQQNRRIVESDIKRNNAGELSPQEQVGIVTANRSAKLERGDFTELPKGDRNEQTARVLSIHREKLLKKEHDLEFERGKLEVQAKQK
jgi:hypothetical protein